MMLQTTGSSRPGTSLLQVSACSGGYRTSDLLHCFSPAFVLFCSLAELQHWLWKSSPPCPEHLIFCVCAVLLERGRLTGRARKEGELTHLALRRWWAWLFMNKTVPVFVVDIQTLQEKPGRAQNIVQTVEDLSMDVPNSWVKEFIEEHQQSRWRRSLSCTLADFWVP